MRLHKFFLLPFSILLLEQGNTWSQTISSDSSGFKNKIGFHTGFEHNLYLDELVSPLIYKGNGLKLGINYHRQNNKSQFDIALDYAVLYEKLKYHQEDRIIYFTPPLILDGETISEYLLAPTRMPHAGLRIAYYRNCIPTQNKRITIYMGGSFSSNIRIYEGLVGGFSPYWLNELNIAMKGDYAFNSKLKISIGAELPVFALLIRYPYSLNTSVPNDKSTPFSPIKAVTWNKYQSVSAFMNIDYLLNRRFALQLNISCYYLRYSYPKSIHFLQHNSTIGISYSF